MEGLGQYLRLSDSARLIVFHTYKLNEKGEKVTRQKLESILGKKIITEGLKDIFSQREPLIERENNKSYIVSQAAMSYFRLL
jgi:hypothetical protein